MNEPARNPSRGTASHPRSDPSIRRRARDLAQLAPSQKKTAEAAERTTTAEKAGGEGAIGVRSGGGRRKFIRPSSTRRRCRHRGSAFVVARGARGGANSSHEFCHMFFFWLFFNQE